jgi:2,3-bisphosphoglycerate-dependent phosphoglycerate mutase
MAERGLLPDVLHTSVQVRAIRTAELALCELGRSWIPVRRHWRLNERHYGDLQGLNKAETAERFGLEQVKVWRRAYDVPPPPMARDDPRNVRHDPRYADLPPEIVPDTECLADVVERMLPYWYDAIVPDLAPGRVVLVAAHGNSLRALVKHLSHIGDEAITELNIPTGEPLVYELGDDYWPLDDTPVEERYLRSAEEIRAAAEAVARQAGG